MIRDKIKQSSKVEQLFVVQQSDSNQKLIQLG